GNSWVWAHCHQFVNDSNEAVSFSFEAFYGRSRVLGSLPSPLLAVFFFMYQGQRVEVHSLFSKVRIQSRHDLSGWSFRVDHKELSFHVEIQADLREFAGSTFEDTHGSSLNCAYSGIANSIIHIYRNGKRESTFRSRKTTSYEVVSQDKNP